MTTPAINPFLEDDSDLEGERLQLRWLPVDKIPSVLWEQNPKKHSLSEIWESIVKFGFIDPPKFDTQLKNRNGEWGAIQYGNGRSEAVHWGWEAYKRGDYKGAVPKGISVDKEGMWYIPVKVGINAENEAMASDFGVFHNTSTMLGGDFEDGDIWRLFDAKELLKIGKTVLSNKDFEPLAMTGEEVDSLLKFIEGDKEIPSAPDAQIDRAEELNKVWGVKTGDLWIIPSKTGEGEHRLLCGDSTKAEDVARLMGDEKADIVFTDPPYGMDLDTDFSGMKSKLLKGKTGGNYHEKVIGDNQDFNPYHIFEFFNYCPEIFLWGADYYAESLPAKNDGSWFVWDKRLDESADKMWGSGFELCWSKARHKRDIIRIKWAGIFGMETQDTQSRVHPTQKPIELAEWVLGRIQGQLVVDLYLGSGFTMVACERLQRFCYGTEIDPDYCAVILQRLADMGLEPYKED